MITIIFEAHATTYDNAAGKASGWNDIDLSDLGLTQAAEMGRRYKDHLPDLVFCSDLQRSYKTAAIAFKDSGVPIIIDSRLRECNYGRLTRAGKTEVELRKIECIGQPFPDGESYRDTSRRMKAFLDNLTAHYAGKAILIIGHRATQYGLEEHLLGKDLRAIISASWSWQPGWTYQAQHTTPPIAIY